MNVAEQMVVEHKRDQRFKKLDDIKFKLFGQDKFVSKNGFVENYLDSIIKYFSASKTIDYVKEAQTSEIRNQILKNQRLMEKRSSVQRNSSKKGRRTGKISTTKTS